MKCFTPVENIDRLKYAIWRNKINIGFAPSGRNFAFFDNKNITHDYIIKNGDNIVKIDDCVMENLIDNEYYNESGIFARMNYIAKYEYLMIGSPDLIKKKIRIIYLEREGRRITINTENESILDLQEKMYPKIKNFYRDGLLDMQKVKNYERRMHIREE